jgi:hypothetical protein
MNNILTAIANIASFRENNLNKYATKYLIRINAVGDRLEFYIQDAIAGTFNKEYQEKEAEYKKIFSWQGSQNNPPDLIIRQGDAFEIKKIEGLNSSLALNSSPPKNTLLSTDPRITKECKKCEDNWREKDIFYTIGSVNKNIIKYLFFVQGKCYTADHSVYDSLHSSLKKEIESVMKARKIQYKKTVELGGIENTDPLGITSLRIRGMWNIKNPIEIFSDIIDFDENKGFSLFAIMDSFPEEDRRKIEKMKEIVIKDIKIKNPNNPDKFIESKLISFNF